MMEPSFDQNLILGYISYSDSVKNFYKKWHDCVVQLTALVFFAIYAGVINTHDIIFYPVFFEGDPTISYPTVTEQVPNSMLAKICILVPSAVIFIIILVDHRKYFGTQIDTSNTGSYNNSLWKKYHLMYRFQLLFWLGTGLALSLLISMSIYGTFKFVIAVPRPNFLSLCNYAGYADLYNSNLTIYYKNITLGAIGDYTRCIGSASDIRDGLLSFPSGHAALSWTSMVYSMFLYRYLLGIHDQPDVSIHQFISRGFLILSTWISITRVQDYEHHTIDVTAGALIGIFIATMVWNFVRKVIVDCVKPK